MLANWIGTGAALAAFCNFLCMQTKTYVCFEMRNTLCNISNLSSKYHLPNLGSFFVAKCLHNSLPSLLLILDTRSLIRRQQDIYLGNEQSSKLTSAAGAIGYDEEMLILSGGFASCHFPGPSDRRKKSSARKQFNGMLVDNAAVQLLL